MKRSLLLACVLLMMVWGGGVATAQEIVVPLFAKPPTLDGKIDSAQWAGAARIDGFVTDSKLERRAVHSYVGATHDTLYVAIQSRLPDQGPLLATVSRDTLKVVYDDAVEVFVDPAPGATDRVAYHMLANSLNHAGFETAVRGKASLDASWSGNWPHASSLANGYWNFECAIPIASLTSAGPGRTATQGTWLINLCRDWRPDWGWSSFTGQYLWSGLTFRFTDQPAPVVRQIIEGDPTYAPGDKVKLSLELYNPSTSPLPLKAGLKLVRNNMPGAGAGMSGKLSPGGTTSVSVPLDAHDPTTLFNLQASVSSDDANATYFSRELHWSRAASVERWVTEKPKDAALVDLQFAYYPSKNHMRVRADIAALPADAHPDHVSAIVRNRLTHAEIKSVPFPLDRFANGRQEIAFDLPDLNGYYELAVQVSGPQMKMVEAVKDFQRIHYPWENLPTGLSTTVYAPFTPIVLKDWKLSTVLRTYSLGDSGLVNQVATTNDTTKVTKDLLAGPMRYVATVDGKSAPVKSTSMQITESQGNEAKTQGSFVVGSVPLLWNDTWDYDGTAKVSLTLQPTNGHTINDLTLEIPLRADIATLLHANADRIRNPVAEKLPPGDGVVWDGSKVACDEYIKNFCPYVFLGDGNRGLCWFADNDRNWGWNHSTPNLEVVRHGDQVLLRVHLINQPTVITEPRTIVYGLLATPIKPRLNPGSNPNWWRYRANRDQYVVMGTDINWFANNSAGSVYPVGQDMYLWEEIARGSREKLSDAEVEGVIQHGMQYFTPYGKDSVDMWVHHVNVNLRAHLNHHMVFYYNRASCEEYEEYQTFKDEWSLDDLRPAEPAKPRDEIKVVPTESYDNYNLYWNARSFEVGNNKGVYWDNWFIAPSFNTEMTDAYRTPDGSIMPSAGIWAMRAQAKRTFQMMNEKGMLPIIFPHITSFSCLPMLSFATVQYEWEWKYSEGDVQDRFTRDYIQLVTTGEQAGTWPVPLHDQLKLENDPWTQRTFAAVRLVHELDGTGGYGTTDTLLKPVFAILDKPGTQAYRYWDDRPMPAHVSNADVPLLVYSRPGAESLIIATSYAAADADATLDVDWKALGLSPSATVTNAITGQRIEVRDGRVLLPIKKHDIQLIHIQ